MPSPSRYPILLSLGLLVIISGALIGLWLLGLGVAIAIYAVYGWAYEPYDH